MWSDRGGLCGIYGAVCAVGLPLGNLPLEVVSVESSEAARSDSEGGGGEGCVGRSSAMMSASHMEVPGGCVK